MRKFTDKEKKEILAYADKHSVAEAAEVYGIRKNYVYRWRKEQEQVETIESKPKKARKAPAKEVNLESLKVQLQERLQEVDKIKAIIAYLETGKV